MSIRNTMLAVGITGMLASSAAAATPEEINKLTQGLRDYGQYESVVDPSCGNRGSAYREAWPQKFDVNGTRYDSVTLCLVDIGGSRTGIGLGMVRKAGNGISIRAIFDGGNGKPLDGTPDYVFNEHLTRTEAAYLFEHGKGSNLISVDRFSNRLTAPSKHDRAQFEQFVRWYVNDVKKRRERDTKRKGRWIF